MAAPPTSVLSQYPAAVAGLCWEPLGSAGGFSGAAVWRGDSRFALKAWPPGYDPARLREVHAAIALAHDLPFVPNVIPTTTGRTAVETGGRVWDVTTWLPGVADFASNPSDVRLAAAMAALAALHRAWTPATTRIDVCPGVVRRLAVTYRAHTVPPALPALPVVAARAAAALRPWLVRPLPLQLCLRDIHADHVLFTDDRVTGVIDYGAVAVDHPAVDLARLLGDLVGTDPARVRRGVEMYLAAGGVPGVEADFVIALADAGLVGSVLRWLDHPPETPAAAARFRVLVARLEARAAGGC